MKRSARPMLGPNARPFVEWDVADVRGSMRTGFYFVLTAVSALSNEATGPQPVTVKSSRAHPERLTCLTHRTGDCGHVRFVARYIARHGSPERAYFFHHQLVEWLKTSNERAEADGLPF